MERLVLLCLLSPAIFAQPRKGKDPNDEPFLPIFPVYPYNPKLIKRGAERELTTQLTSKLYAPKVDTKDSYSHSANYQRDSYYSPDLKNRSPVSAYPSYYNSDAYAYVHSPYAVYNSYATPYAVNPAAYSAPVYPNYHYQQPYYYPHYYNHALFPPPPPSPPSQPGVVYQETSQDSAETEDDQQDKQSKQSKKVKDDETNQDVPSTSQYVDGGNYISSGGARDLDVQSSTYKLASPYNQLEGNIQVRNLPIPLPKATYRLINVAGQPVSPNYPPPTTYIKIQQMEQQVSQALAKLLAQQQAGRSYGTNHRDTLSDANGGSYATENIYNLNAPPYVTLPTVKTAKPAIAYVINADGTAKVNGAPANSQGSSPQKNKSTKSNALYVRKPAAAQENSQATNSKYRASDSRSTDQMDEYDGYDASQSYAGDKQKSNYYQSGSYQNKDFTATPQSPQSFTYQYSAYASDQTQQPQLQEDKISTDDSNFGDKQYNKG